MRTFAVAFGYLSFVCRVDAVHLGRLTEINRRIEVHERHGCVGPSTKDKQRYPVPVADKTCVRGGFVLFVHLSLVKLEKDDG